VRQFLNAQREGPIGMAEEKDAGELESEKGIELGALPPIPAQLPTSSGQLRPTERVPGSWLKAHGVVPPPGSFPGLDLDFGAPAEVPARERVTTGGVRVVPSVSTQERVNRARAAAARSAATVADPVVTAPAKAPAAKAPAAKAPAAKAPAAKTAAARTPAKTAGKPARKAPGATTGTSGARGTKADGTSKGRGSNG
jgi:hypothetical protein